MLKNKSRHVNKKFPVLLAEKTQTITFAEMPAVIFGTINKEGYNEELVKRCNEYDQLKAENERLKKLNESLLKMGNSTLVAENEVLKVGLTAARNFIQFLPNEAFSERGIKDKNGLIEGFNKLLNK